MDLPIPRSVLKMSKMSKEQRGFFASADGRVANDHLTHGNRGGLGMKHNKVPFMLRMNQQETMFVCKNM